MRQLTAILHPGEPNEGGYWATCLEVPGANGQGETKDECLASLAESVRLLLQIERENAFQDPAAEEISIAV
jgi:predicted RNase H-like HicB family nuclease